MSTPPESSMSKRDVRAAKDTLQFCQDWHDAIR